MPENFRRGTHDHCGARKNRDASEGLRNTCEKRLERVDRGPGVASGPGLRCGERGRWDVRELGLVAFALRTFSVVARELGVGGRDEVLGFH